MHWIGKLALAVVLAAGAVAAWFQLWWLVVLAAFAIVLAVWLLWDRLPWDRLTQRHYTIRRVADRVVDLHETQLSEIGAASIYRDHRGEDCVGDAWFKTLDDLIAREVMPLLSPKEQAVLSDPRTGLRSEIRMTITERVVWCAFNERMRRRGLR
jgi:hypothetical protein